MFLGVQNTYNSFEQQNNKILNQIRTDCRSGLRKNNLALTSFGRHLSVKAHINSFFVLQRGFANACMSLTPTRERKRLTQPLIVDTIAETHNARGIHLSIPAIAHKLSCFKIENFVLSFLPSFPVVGG